MQFLHIFTTIVVIWCHMAFSTCRTADQHRFRSLRHQLFPFSVSGITGPARRAVAAASQSYQQASSQSQQYPTQQTASYAATAWVPCNPTAPFVYRPSVIAPSAPSPTSSQQPPCTGSGATTTDFSLFPSEPTAWWGPRVGRLAHPLVLPIMHGNFSQHSDGKTLMMHPSITLVVDERTARGERHYILVDTGLTLYTQYIIDGLRANGVLPSDIDTVIITHGDTDTMGNLNVFRCAEIYSSNRISKEGFFTQQMAPIFDGNRSDLPFHRLYDNTELYLTPGYGLQDHSLVVHNVEGHGTVAIVGKLIINETDVASSNTAIREFAVDDVEQRKLWQATRREIVCLSDYIIPGLGPPFKVTAELKRLAECQPARPTSEEIVQPFGKS